MKKEYFEVIYTSISLSKYYEYYLFILYTFIICFIIIIIQYSLGIQTLIIIILFFNTPLFIYVLPLWTFLTLCYPIYFYIEFDFVIIIITRHTFSLNFTQFYYEKCFTCDKYMIIMLFCPESSFDNIQLQWWNINWKCAYGNIGAIFLNIKF